MNLADILAKLKTVFASAWSALKAFIPLMLAVAVFTVQNHDVILSAASLLI
jgi:hypothetical protein